MYDQPLVLLQEVPPGQSVEDMVGRPLVHLSAAKQASGEAVYCDDIPHYENELYLTLVTSTKAHAKIVYVLLLQQIYFLTLVIAKCPPL